MDELTLFEVGAYVINTDGGSRGNPGPSAIGFCITTPDGQSVCEGGWPIGRSTNNEAEYKALIWGLTNALATGIRSLSAVCDSELMVKQVLGEYRVKKPELAVLHSKVLELIEDFDNFSIKHAHREHNKRPDELVNIALDTNDNVGNFAVGFDEELSNKTNKAEIAESSEISEKAESSEKAAAITQQSFKKPVVLVGVTGCIAAYKACELVRILQKAGMDVKVVMTQNATRFVGPATFRALTGHPVSIGLFDEAGDPIHHISLAKEADCFVICPATANTLIKIATGYADDLLSTTALATKAPIVVAPAMNCEMWANQLVQDAIEKLREQNVIQVGPDSGYLSCGDEGAGRMSDPHEIAAAVLQVVPQIQGELAGKKVLLTSGSTHEPIDPVRYIANRSSGLSGKLIAQELSRRGAQVVFVSGKASAGYPIGAGIEVVKVQNASEMYEAAKKVFDDVDAAIFCAAVADYKVKNQRTNKIKKSDNQKLPPILELEENPDILASLAATKKDQFVVGFAAETVDIVEYAKQKLLSKNADLIVANDVGDPSIGFESQDNNVWLITSNTQTQTGVISKELEAKIIVDEVQRAIN